MIAWLTKLLSGTARERTPPAGTTPAPATPAAAAVAGESGDETASGSDIDRLFTGWLLGVHSPVDADLNNTERQLIGALKKCAESEHDGCKLVPRVPSVIPQLMRSLRDENATGATIADQIAQDATMVGEIIRLANSPYYRAVIPTTSIEGAVRRLGRQGLRQMIATVAFRPIINVQTGHFARTAAHLVWSQAEKSAIAARCLSRHAGVDPFEAFLAGLVHSVGISVALTIMDQNYDGADAPRSVQFHALFDQFARRLSEQVVRGWEFPEKIVQAIQEQTFTKPSLTLAPLGNVLHAADRLAKIRILVDNGRLADNPAYLSCGRSGLSRASCTTCYAELTPRSFED